MRKPRLSAEEVLKASKISTDREAYPKNMITSSPLKNRFTYSIEILAQLAMSPLCLTEPDEWEKIVQEYPTLVRKVVQCFDAKQYLTVRTEDLNGVLNAEDVEEV